MSFNIIKKDNISFNPFFIKTLKNNKLTQIPHNTPSLICSKSSNGKYCINTTIKNSDVFNKITTSIYLQNCPFYPKTHILYNQNNFNNIKLDNKYYYVKPKYGNNSKNISLYKQKELIIGTPSNLQFPLIFQEEVQNLKTFNNHKYDLRIHILYILTNNDVIPLLYKDAIKRQSFKDINSPMSPDSIFTNVKDLSKINEQLIQSYHPPELIKCLKNANQFIIPKLKKIKITHELELLMTGYDIIIDNNNKHWILEINCNPALNYDDEVRKETDKMLTEILYIILSYHNTKKINPIKFIKL